MIRFGVSEDEENKIEMTGRAEGKLKDIRKNLITEEDGIKKRKSVKKLY